MLVVKKTIASAPERLSNACMFSCPYSLYHMDANQHTTKWDKCIKVYFLPFFFFLADPVGVFLALDSPCVADALEGVCNRSLDTLSSDFSAAAGVDSVSSVLSTWF